MEQLYRAAGHLNSSTFFTGVMILLLNIGSRYITHEFSDSDEEYQKNILLRRLTVFAVCFVGTRDVIISILLTAGFVVLAGGIFRGSSVFAREGMQGRGSETPAVGEVDDPAYDKSVKEMFGSSQ